MKKQWGKIIEIGVETLNYWVISYALDSMTMVFRSEWVYVLFFASNIWLIGYYYERMRQIMSSRKWAVLMCVLSTGLFALFVFRAGLVQGTVMPFQNL